jgi:hypothetical protein
MAVTAMASLAEKIPGIISAIKKKNLFYYLATVW